MSKTLPVFTKTQRDVAHQLLAAKVAYMLGRKMEEADWCDVYCKALGFPIQPWSNLNVDLAVPGLGVEQKMLRLDSRPIREWCGTRQMHPALTRQVSLPAGEDDPNKAMKAVIQDYQRVMESRREKIRELEPDRSIEMRSGWLLYQSELTEFLYFEEPTENLDPDAHYAEWSERAAGSRRRGSRNLWIFEKTSGQKVWSVTGAGSGTKIQPYFTVPPAGDSHLYFFRVQGEREADGLVRIWVTLPTYSALQSMLPNLEPSTLSEAILEAKPLIEPLNDEDGASTVKPLRLTGDAYERLRQAFAGSSDEHSMQLLVRQLSKH